MDVKYVVPDLKTALTQQLFPTITVWNRLEGRPRENDFSRALKAEVRDPLWMLTKQWQLGEFQADDAGSPVFAKLRMRTAPVTKYQPGGAATEPFESNVPMEVKAEQRVLQWQWNGQKMRFDLRAQLGRQWGNMLRDSGLPTYIPKYVVQYPITLPPQDETSDYIYAHRQAWQQYAALAGRAMDGGDLHLYLLDPAHHASDGIALDAPGDETSVTSFIPTPVTFEGMPDPRWWALEDRKTDFGAVNPSTTDLAQLLLMEFSLVYANDWFLFPHQLPAGTL